MSFQALQPSFILHTLDYRQMYERGNLGEFISAAYECSGLDETLLSEGPHITVVPDLSADIIFNCSGNASEAMVMGPVIKPMPALFKPNSKYFGVRLRPLTTAMLLGHPDAEFLGHDIPLLDIFPRSRSLIERIQEEPSMKVKVDLLYQLLNTQKIKRQASNRLTYILQRIFEMDGTIPVNVLAEELGYSPRHLYSLFMEQFGIGIKSFCRIVRFQAAVRQILLSESSGTEIAYELGYYDQAHFIREFRSFSSVSPSYYIGLTDEKISEIAQKLL